LYQRCGTVGKAAPMRSRERWTRLEECREICIRAKWSYDGAKTLIDAATRLRDYAADLEGLAALDFELRDEIEDDYGFVGRPDDGGPAYPEDDEDEPSVG
jgi:hypothetical protein